MVTSGATPTPGATTISGDTSQYIPILPQVVYCSIRDTYCNIRDTDYVKAGVLLCVNIHPHFYITILRTRRQ